MKKKIGIIVGILAVLVIVGGAAVGLSVGKDLKQEKKLNEESEKIVEVMDWENMDEEEVNELLSRTVTTGDYAKVEKAVKNYMQDVADCAQGIKTVASNEIVLNALTPANLQNDGPDFVSTKQGLSDAKEAVSTLPDRIRELISKDKIYSYIDPKMDDYYIDLYKEMTKMDEPSIQEGESSAVSVEQLSQMIGTQQETIELLSQNAGTWEVQGEQIMFESEDTMNQYNELLNQIGSLQSQMQ